MDTESQASWPLNAVRAQAVMLYVIPTLMFLLLIHTLFALEGTFASLPFRSLRSADCAEVGEDGLSKAADQFTAAR